MAISFNTSFTSPSAISGQNSTNDSLQKLASGSKINSASDDAAGLAISDGCSWKSPIIIQLWAPFISLPTRSTNIRRNIAAP